MTAFDQWLRLRDERGESVGVITLYELVAAERGVSAEDLSYPERLELGRLALRVMFPGYEVTTGSERGEERWIALVPYDPSWPDRFDVWKQKLLTVLGGRARRIEHIGSTAVPGLAAKPIVDIQVSVDAIADEPGYVPRIESIGVQLRSRDDDHRYFRPFAGRRRDVHVHVCNAGSAWERRHVLFRDYLRASEPARRAYLQVKQDAAERWSDDAVAYTHAKDEVIRKLTAEAESWSRR